MSQKNLRRKRKGTPRAMPVETILTRYKSAQLKQQHEQKQNNSNKIKVPMKNRKMVATSTPVKKVIKHVVDIKDNKSTEILKKVIETEQTEEYYPDKLRRPLLNKKVVLVHKTSYKLVGSLKSFNKRKLRKPNKELMSPVNVSPHKYYCTMNKNNCDTFNTDSEMRIMDSISIGSDSLDEEDLLEILTCPSPVWWEDSPDYDEGSMSMKYCQTDVSGKLGKQTTNSNETIKEQDEINKIPSRNEQGVFDSKRFAISVNNRDKNFVNKRNKLEELLGNLKNKSSTKITKTKLNVVNNKDLITSNNTTISQTQKGVSECCDEKILDKTTAKPNAVKHRDHSISNTISPLSDRTKRTSESCDEELSEDFDDILCSLENIDIPIKISNPETTNIISDKGASGSKSQNEIKDLKSDCKIKPLLTNANSVTGRTISKCDIRTKPVKNSEITNKIAKDITIKKDKMVFLKSLTGDIKILKKNSKNIASKTETNLLSNRNHQPMPVTGLKISSLDKILITPENNNLTINNNKIKLKSKKTDEGVSKISDELGTQNSNAISDNSSDHITVYQIVSEQETNSDKNSFEPKLDVNNEYNTQLSSYYNQCKYINKNSKEAMNIRNKIVNNASNINSASVKSVPLPNNETVQYCLQCSSIFNTDKCQYCATKLEINTNDRSKSTHKYVERSKYRPC